MSQAAEAFPVEPLHPWLTQVLLPFWAETGFDPENGAFVEKFEPDGTPSTADFTRVRVQARQIYVFSHAAHAGYSGVGLARARQAFDFLEAHAWDREAGGWFQRLRRDGPPLDRTKDSYDHAFMLLAMAWLYRAGGDARVLKRAEQTIEFLDAHLGQTRDGAFDGYAEWEVAPGEALPLPRRQNPHMHLLEAFLALYEASGAERWLAQAQRIFGLFERHFFDATSGQLIEYFDRDWREIPQPEGPGGRRRREPGHHFEWVWLLHRYAGLAQDDRAAAAMRPLFDWAWDKGIDRAGAAPFVVYEELDPAGRVLGGGSKRLWAQTEAVKACLAVYERFGDDSAAEGAGLLLGGLFRTFAGLDHPRWREQVDREGNLIREGMPSSSLYHLFLAVAEAIRVLPAAEDS
ncbi:AGE family epimerase/isomerase [Pelagibius marinus]|uniref:AGE family epimerase/isomerase n=1 Tax=Pelagibius marinus TaxID=2762760 RepID=UPI0018723D34|nr:AGE family epimerase/isomerase [Pelagibius marinus]